jgi:hypothetical protein
MGQLDSTCTGAHRGGGEGVASHVAAKAGGAQRREGHATAARAHLALL